MKELITALAELRANVNIDKTGINTYHNNAKYHTIDDLIKGLQHSSEHGLGFTQTFDGNDLVTTIVHLESGQQLEGRIYIGDYNEAQKWAGAVTYKRRIALVTMFGLSEPDDDGNQTINTAAAQSKKKEAKPLETSGIDHDYSGAPYRLMHTDGSVKAEFTDIKAWGLATKKALSAANVDQRLPYANALEINRVYDEVATDELMHHKTKTALIKSLDGLKELIPNA